MKAPFPYFGGKSKVADVIWRAFGNPAHYVEPFFGSGAVLLARPHAPKVETVNDIDGLLCNFWRAIRFRTEETAEHAIWLVSELDLHARHDWLVGHRESITEALRADPEWCDPRAAGWWVWGISCWIGGGWGKETSRKLPHLGHAGKGIHRTKRQRPHLGDAGMGIHALDPNGVRPYFLSLSERMAKVRVCCGDWSRVVTDGALSHWERDTAILLDPPYDQKMRDGGCYSCDEAGISAQVRAWALDHGHRYKIALCGYDGEHEMPPEWEAYAWKANAAYQNSSAKEGANEANRAKERAWFSPRCNLVGKQLSLLCGDEVA